MKLTKTQQSIMDVIGEKWESPTRISERAGIDNSGGAAASLRVLLRAGLVEQRSAGKYRSFELFEYRRKPVEQVFADAFDPEKKDGN